MKRGMKAVVVGVVVFVVLNLLFFLFPSPVNVILNPISKLLIVVFGSGLYDVIFGSEYREFFSLSILVSIIIGIISYFIIPNKNES